MRPFDRSVLPLLRAGRAALVASVAATLVSGLLVIVQAFVVTGAVVSIVDHHRVGDWAVWVVAVFAGRAAATWVADVLAARAAAQVGLSLRHRVVQATVARAGRGDRVGALSPGGAATLCTRGISAIEPYLTRFLPALVIASTLPLLTVVAIGSQDLVSAVIVIVTLPLIPVFAALVGWSTQARAQRQWRQLAVLSGHFLDVVKGLPTLVAYRRADAQTATIRRVTDRYRRASLETLRLAFASSAVLELVATLSVALVAVCVGLRLAAGDLGLSTALVVLLLAPEAYWPLRRVGAEFHAASEGGATLKEVAAVLDRPAAAVTEAPLLNVDDDGTIVLDHLSVTYPGRAVAALAPLSVQIGRGELVAISGPSGAGKSTLLGALRGGLAYDGTILVGGRDLRSVDQDTWQAGVAWLPQRPWFVAGTVADNVRLGRPDASDTDIWEALTKVGLDRRVGSLAGGLQAAVSQDGGSLSAGERARLALARAVVSRRPLVLLDEPTAHLDAESERVVLDTLRWLAGQATVVVVAHRQAVVDAADRVVHVRPPQASSVPPADDLMVTTAVATDGRRPVTVPAADDLPGLTVPSTRAAEEPSRSGAPSRTPEVSPRTDDSEQSAGTERRLAWGIVLGVLASLAGVALTATAGWLIVRASEQPPVLTLLVAIIGVRTFGIARPALRYLERLTSHDAALRTLADRRAQVYADLVPLTPGALGRRRGDLLASVVDDVDAEVDLRLRVWSPIATGAGVGLVAGGLAALVSVRCGVVLVVLTLGALATVPVCRRLAARAERAFVGERADLSDQVTAAVEGADQLVAWQAEAEALSRVDAVGHRLARAAVRSATAGATCRAGVLALVGVAVALIADASADALSAGRVSAPVAALLVLVPLGLAEVLVAVPDAGLVAARVREALARLNVLSNAQPLVGDPVDPRPLPDQPSALEAQMVTAGWGASAVLHDVDLTVRPGRRVGVVGPSGCGKSTLAAVLLRYLDPSVGQVDLGHTDLRDLALSDVRGEIGLVDDDPHVFASSVVENVRFSRPGASDAEVEEVVRAVRLGEWLDALPDGLGTFLGEQGQAVSGGERARLALARSLLADQPIVVLDEPVAHLDHATATLVLGDLLVNSRGRTVVLISHRSEGFEDLDDILDLGARQDSLTSVTR